jgi:transforming growth factor-beta-induced protein
MVAGAFKAADLTDGQVIQTLLPAGELTVIKNATGVFLQPSGGPIAQVTTADVEADNGIVHIIDGVLLPATAPGPAAE